jgi:hypothetical protein
VGRKLVKRLISKGEGEKEGEKKDSREKREQTK